MENKRLVLLGAPGVGKGTQAREMEKNLSLSHISSGDMLRDAVRSQSRLGIRVKEYLARGDLVPDELMMSLVSERLQENKCAGGFVLDGYPRTVSQARALDALLEERDLPLTGAVLLEIPRNEIIRRLSMRYTCDTCGETIKSKENRENQQCPNCGNRLKRRSDDEPRTIEHRLGVYEELTSPLIEFYQCTGILHRVNGMGTVREVFQRILSALNLN